MEATFGHEKGVACAGVLDVECPEERMPVSIRAGPLGFRSGRHAGAAHFSRGNADSFAALNQL